MTTIPASRILSLRSALVLASVVQLSYLYLSPTVLLLINLGLKTGPPEQSLAGVKWFVVGLAALIAFITLLHQSKAVRLTSLGLGAVLGGVAFNMFSAILPHAWYLFLSRPSPFASGLLAGFAISVVVIGYSTVLLSIYDRVGALERRLATQALSALAVVVIGIPLLTLLIGKFGLFDVRGFFGPTEDPSYRLEPSVWFGSAQPSALDYPFELVIQHVQPHGHVAGYLDWGPGRVLAITGTHRGNYLEFQDTGAMLNDGAESFNDRITAWIEGDRLVGTIQGKGTAFRATRLTTGTPLITTYRYISEDETKRLWAQDITRCEALGRTGPGERCWRGLAFRAWDYGFCYNIVPNLERAMCVNEVQWFVDRMRIKARQAEAS